MTCGNVSVLSTSCADLATYLPFVATFHRTVEQSAFGSLPSALTASVILMSSDDPALGSDRFPGLRKPRFTCPTCDAYAHHVWGDILVQKNNRPTTHLQITMKSGSPISRWMAAQCASCNDWSVWFDDTMVHPAGRVGPPPHLDMPAEVRDLYEEASSVGETSRRAAAALARAVVEQLLKHLDPQAPKKAKLDARIERIRDQVSTSLGQMLDVVRATGNSSLHGDETPTDLVVILLDDQEGAEMLELLLETANDLVDEMITRPRRKSELWDKLSPGIKASIQSKSQTQST